VKVSWRPSAVADAIEAVVFAGEGSTRANELTRRFARAADTLSDFPYLGKEGRVPETRELILGVRRTSFSTASSPTSSESST
jgi:plasmid stabilization system protein ParE